LVASSIKVPFVDLNRQYEEIGPAIEEQVLAVLRSGRYVSGPEVSQLEDEFASFCDTRHAVAVNSGTAALHVALLALGVGPGDEVITVAHTFVATAEAIVAIGATPVFVDIDPATCNMDATALAAAITPKTKVILPVHLYGQCAPMDEILAIAERHAIPVVEDACQAHGATFDGRPAGSMGAIGCFSFYPSKNLGAAGEGGMAVTMSAELAAKMRQFRDHGQAKRYYHEAMGYNYRLPEIQAAVLRVKLPLLNGWNEARRAAAARYDELLSGIELASVAQLPKARSVYHLYVVRTPRRDIIAKTLELNGIGTGVHYPVPVHLQTPFRQFGGGEGSLPHTEAAAREVLSLPMFPEITSEEIDAVVQQVRIAVEGRSNSVNQA
jgi:dTDP-4-amino-4,6-dideoxygalactose transaminase